MEFIAKGGYKDNFFKGLVVWQFFVRVQVRLGVDLNDMLHAI